MVNRKKEIEEKLRYAVKQRKCGKHIRIDGLKLICVTCADEIVYTEATIGPRITNHLGTKKHKKQVGDTVNQLIEPVMNAVQIATDIQDEFEDELLETFLKAGIELYKVRNPVLKQFLEKWCKKKVPSESTLRRKVAAKADQVIEKVKKSIGSSDVFMIVDETTDRNARNVVNIMVGRLDGHSTRPMLLDVVFQTKTNNDTMQNCILQACSTCENGFKIFYVNKYLRWIKGRLLLD